MNIKLKLKLKLKLYPEGWRFREFVGIFRNSANSAKKTKPNDNSIVNQVMAEAIQPPVQGHDQLLHSLQQQVKELLQQQGQGSTLPTASVSGHGEAGALATGGAEQPAQG